MSEPIATWNPARGAWETPVLNLLCGHLEPFSQTWPKSGSMRNGRVFPRPVPGPAISAGASLSSPGLLPTPVVADSRNTRNATAGRSPGSTVHSGMTLCDAVQLLPTPRASANENRQTKRTPSQEAGDHGLCLAAEVLELLPTTGGGFLPTPASRDWKSGRSNIMDRNARPLNEVVEMFLGGQMTPHGGDQEPSAATRQQSGSTSESSAG